MSNIIKSGHGQIQPQIDPEAVLEQSKAKSREILQSARASAEAMVNSAKKEGFKKGYDEGFRQGFSEGSRAAINEKQPLIEELSQYRQRLSEYYNKPVAADDFIEDALELAKSIIATELKKNDDAFYGLYKKAALHINNTDKAVLKVGPRGYEAVSKNKSKFESAIDGLEELKITLEGDDDGLCVLETPLGNVDASVGAQFERAKKIIFPQN